MCDYSVAARPRRNKAKKDEELILVNLANHSGQHVVRGFASPMNLQEPVCMMPGTKLRFIGLSGEQAALALPKEGVAEFVQTDINDPYATHDALKFGDEQIVKLVHLQPGMQVRVMSTPEQKLVETPQVGVLQHVHHPVGVRAQ